MPDLHWSVCGLTPLCCVGSLSYDRQLVYIVSFASLVRPATPMLTSSLKRGNQAGPIPLLKTTKSVEGDSLWRPLDCITER